jgi:hypothetical protein
MFTRQGSCNRCGECCGYPRSTNGGQNNPWPNDWPESIRNWSPESIQTHLPILQFVDNMVNTPNGNFTIQGHRCYWIWIPGHGLCIDLPAYGDPVSYDQRCPCLGDKQAGNDVPCRLYGTRYQPIWQAMCEATPPVTYERQSQVDNWFINCPSCSYIYVEG